MITAALTTKRSKRHTLNVPRVLSAEILSDGRTLEITFDRNCEYQSYDGFTLSLSGGAASLSVLLPSSPTLQYTIGRAVDGAETATLSYTPGAIWTAGVNTDILQSFSALPVTNSAGSADSDPPGFTSASISVNGLTTTVLFDEDVTGSTGLTLSASGGAVTLSGAVVQAMGITFNNSRVIQFGETVTISYTPGNIKDLFNNALASFSAQPVTNNSIATSGDPTLPATVDTTLPTGWDGAANVTLTDASNLQTAIASANVSSGMYIIELTAGDTWTGNFVIPDTVATGTNWLVIRSSGFASLTSGERVVPADAVHMGTITCPDQINPALIIEPTAKKVLLVGLNITTNYAVTSGVQYGVFRIGWDSATGGALTVSPADTVIVDRCFVHGTSTGNIRDGIVIYNVSNLAIINCYLNDFHGIGYESHGIHVFNAPGPTLIDNTYVEAGGINIFIGDSVSVNPLDVTVSRCHLFKSLTWKTDDPSYAGTPWSVKNLLEIKCGSRILLTGNRLENSWAGGQHGDGFIFTPRGFAVADVTVRYNYVYNVWSGATVNDADQTINRVLFEHNIFYQFGIYSGALFKLAGTAGENNDIGLRNNTMVHNPPVGTGGAYLNFYGTGLDEVTNLSFRNNLVCSMAYGIFGNGGLSYRNAVIARCNGYVFLNNGVIGGSAGSYGTEDAIWDNWLFAASIDAADFVGGTTFDNLADFALVNTSPFYHQGTDGNDLGANVTSLIAAMSPSDVF